MSVRTVTIREIDVVGPIWMPPVTCAMTYSLTPRDVENIRERSDIGGLISREGVAEWLSLNSGDFQHVEDFRADIEEFNSDWEDEDNDYKWNDCMYGAEDEV